MKLERVRPNVLTMTLTTQELSALVAAARLALEAMREDEDAPPEALELLARVLSDFDTARARVSSDEGR